MASSFLMWAFRLLAFALTFALPAWAQGSTLFSRLMERTLTTHPSVIERRSELSAALSEVDSAEYARYPTPSLERTSSAAPGMNTSALRIEQPLWTGGRITAGIEAAHARAQAATSYVAEARLDVVLRFIAIYGDALRQKERVRNANISVEEHQRLLAMMERRVLQNVNSQADKRLAESRLLQAQNELALSEQAFNNALSQLSQLSGETVKDVSWLGFEPKGALMNLGSLLDMSITASPTLKRLASNELAAKADIDSKQSIYWPQISLRFEKTAGGLYPDTRATLVLTAQPGAGLSARSGVAAAVARREAILQAREAASREIGQRVMVAWNDLQAAKVLMASSDRSSELSKEVFASYSRQFVIGKKTWIDVLNAVRELTQARQTLADAKVQSASSAIRLSVESGQFFDF